MTLALEFLPTQDSPLGGLDPRWRLAALALAAAVAAALQSLPALGTAFLASLVLAWLARLPWSWYLGRVAVVAPVIALFAVWLPFFTHGPGPVWQLGALRVSGYGLKLALLLCLKALTILTLVLVLLATAPLATTLHAAHALRVPGLLIHLTLLTYRYIFLLAGELARIRIALRVRGYRNRPTPHSYRTVGHIAGTLLVRSYERAERVGQAMRCRGFDGCFRSLTQFRTTWQDVAAFLLVVGGMSGLLLWDILQR